MTIQWLAVGAAAAVGLGAGPLGDWQQGEGYRMRPLSVPAAGKTGFTQLGPQQTGIWFTNFLPEPRYRTNQILLNGSGVAAGDVDGDGWCDLYFCRLTGPNALYRNLGQLRFEDITAQAGVACPGLNASGATLTDFDGDGDLDLFVSSVGNGLHVFANDGQAHFTELTVRQPLNPNRGATTMAFGDVDGDGYLDLYVANYRASALMDMPNTHFWLVKVNGRQVVARVNGRPATAPDLTNRFRVNPLGGIDELGEPDVLYRNVQGRGFAAVPFTGGTFLDENGRPYTEPELDWGLTVSFRDLNRDLLPDLYICNDFDGPDRVWINQGDGRFRAIDPMAFRKNTLYSMSVDFGDANRDGFDDMLVLDMLSRHRVHRMTTAANRKPEVPMVGMFGNTPQYMRNMFFVNRGDDTYVELAQYSDLSRTEWSWAVAFLDVDLDGWEDVLVNNGHQREARHLDVIEQLRRLRATRRMTPAEILEARKIFPRLATGNLAFRNLHDLHFQECSQAWGFNFVGVSHGLALADLDNDGDQEVIINNLNDPAFIYRNETAAPRIAVRLKGRPPNTRGIGARLIVYGGPVTQTQEMMSGGRYLSSDQPLRVFAAGSLTNRLTIEVLWRSGRRSVVSNALPNHLYEIEEPDTPTTPPRFAANAGASSEAPWFEDRSAELDHRHFDEPFDDYLRQPLLPRKLSQLGPGVAWCDLDGDGWEDLAIGSGRSGKPAFYRNTGKGRLEPWKAPWATDMVTRDQTALVLWPGNRNKRVLLAGSANYEDGLAFGASVRQYDWQTQQILDTLPGQVASVGPMALADVDADGDLDLFVGGRCLPGRYPMPAPSWIYLNQNGVLQLDPTRSAAFDHLGLVSGAVFSDLDGDGDPDLVLACEWGPVRVFRNESGRFKEATAGLGLDRYRGWWNGVAVGDFDADGRPDIIASNWGRNTEYELHQAKPLRLYYGELGASGTLDLIEAYFDPEFGKYMPERGRGPLAATMPFIQEKYTTHEAFARAGVEEFLGPRIAQAKYVEADWLDTTLFLNRGDKFEARPLPPPAQWSVAFGVSVADFDGDGHQDVFLSQNFFAFRPDIPRLDGGRGLWLRGDGKGGFTPVPGHVSGIKVYGEQRGCAAADYDHDGRVDLVVTQNGARTRLFHNQRARPGLRVRLQGPTANPDAIGAALRARSANGLGPLVEVHAGSGYWSCDSASPVLTAAEPIQAVWVRWPDGRITETPVPAGAREITVRAEAVTAASR